jgi:hypothetical protein
MQSILLFVLSIYCSIFSEQHPSFFLRNIPRKLQDPPYIRTLSHLTNLFFNIVLTFKRFFLFFGCKNKNLGVMAGCAPTFASSSLLTGPICPPTISLLHLRDGERALNTCVPGFYHCCPCSSCFRNFELIKLYLPHSCYSHGSSNCTYQGIPTI